MRLFCENDSTSHPPFPTQVRQPITKGIGTVRLGRPRDPACRTADNGLCRPKAPDKGFGGRCRLPWRVRSSRGLLFRLPNEPSQGSSAARLEKTSMIRLFVAKIFLNIERFSEPGRHGSYRGEYGDRDSENPRAARPQKKIKRMRLFCENDGTSFSLAESSETVRLPLRSLTFGKRASIEIRRTRHPNGRLILYNPTFIPQNSEPRHSCRFSL